MKTCNSFYFDSSRCIKCKSCEVACKQWKGIKAGTVVLRRVTEVVTGTFPDVKRKFLSNSCRHCAKAPCISVCPVAAIRKRDDGIVVVDSQKCIGCRDCLEACPFGVPQFDENGIMQKCDMCLDRLESGLKPFCVEVCPTRALLWGTQEEITAIALKKSAAE